VDEKGRPHKLRLYSIASPSGGEDGSGNIVATTVKRTIDEHWETRRLFLGVASNYLCDLKPGDKVLLTGPSGKRFVLPADREAHDYLFFATGTGIAPFRGMLMELLAAGCRSRIVLVMGAAYETDLLYHDELLKLQADCPNFRYITAISREKQADGHGPLYVQDRIRTDPAAFIPMFESPRTLVYICGLAGMELGIFRQMASVVDPAALDQYLHIEPSAREVGKWERRMLHKEVQVTRRVFLEVY
jgi:ferredoxin--NADP+ reductase